VCSSDLIVAGLLLQSFFNVLQVEKGFRSERTLALNLSLPRRSYSPVQADLFYGSLLERTRALPGVNSVGAVNVIPLVDESMTRLIRLETDADYTRDLERPVAVYRIATPAYFSTIGVPLQAGRFFEEQEPQPVALISTGLAQRLWPGDGPSSIVGRRVRPGDLKSQVVTIVGVVGDVRSGALDRDPMPAIYRPQRGSGWPDMTLVVKTAGDPLAIAAAVRTEISQLDRDLPIGSIKTLDEVVSASLSTRRFQATLVALFAGLALALAAVGIYGVTNYAVALQSREIGLRIALGARPASVLSAVLGRGLRPVIFGLIVGLVAAALSARLIRSFLFGIGPLDATVFAAASAVLLAAAALACYLPARRAAAVDPVTVLRLE